MDSDEFAYPSNLGIEDQDQDQDQYLDQDISSPPTSSSSKTNPAAPTSSNDESAHEQDELKRGHSRKDNFSSGSDLVQVTVEDLLISEELNQTIKASKSQARQPGSSVLESLVQQQQQEQTQTLADKDTDKDRKGHGKESSSSSSISPLTTTIITATIRMTGEKTRSIHFDGDEPIVVVPDTLPQQEGDSSKPKAKTPAGAAANRKSARPPAPRILTPAQQREAEADANIQKAIELHENNQLEEATRYFGLAAQSENPLGQLMYGLSLRHGWGCRPNPTEAIKFLQRAAEYAMGELHELNPSKFIPAISVSEVPQQQQQPKSPQDPEKQQPQGVQQQRQQQQQQQKPSSALSGAQQTLRRMGSMDRREAIVMARKELVMALYELGMSYLKGWGVVKDKAVAFTYFKIAADLGDADAQNETALCYYEGIGVDKDNFESARYYRMAAAQGASQLGNSWIWKPKYDQYCAAENAAATIGTTTATATTTPAAAKKNTNRLSTAIQAAIGSKGRPRSQSNASAGSTPSSPSIPTPHYSISSIASGLASVTAATAGTITPSIRQSLTSPPLAPVSTASTASSSSSSSSLNSISSPTSPISPVSSTAMGSPPTSNIAEPSEKKKGRWTIWGGRPSNTPPSSAVASS